MFRYLQLKSRTLVKINILNPARGVFSIRQACDFVTLTVSVNEKTPEKHGLGHHPHFGL